MSASASTPTVATPQKQSSIGKSDSSFRAPPPHDESVLHLSSSASPSPTSDPLFAAVMALRERWDRACATFEERILVMKPASALALIQSSLNAPAPTDGTLSHDRLNRVVAARYLPLVAGREPSLAPTVLALITSRLRTEVDQEVRQQLSANLGGIPLRPVVARVSDKILETLSADVDDGGNVRWLDAIVPWSFKDATAIQELGLVSANRHDPCRSIALRSLAKMSGGEAFHALSGILREDRTARLLCAPGLAGANTPDVLRHFVEFLPGEHDATWVRHAAAAIEKGHGVPPGAGSVLLSAYRSRPDSADEQRSRIAAAAVGLHARTSDNDAAIVIRASLKADSIQIRRAALSALAEHRDVAFAPELRDLLARPIHPYERELINYALMKLDPSYQVANVYADLEKLKREMESPTLKRSTKAALAREIDQLQDRLEKLKSEP